MHVLIAVETRFYRTPDGTIWTQAQNDYSFWKRYLTVFDQIIVLARVKDVAVSGADWLQANGPNVSFTCLSNYTGPWQYLRNFLTLKKQVKSGVERCDCAILRIAGTISTLAWKKLRKEGVPFGVEVCGDPWESLKPGTVRSVVRPLARIMSTVNAKRQCLTATACSYVSEVTLQRRYPSRRGVYTVGVSDVELSPDSYRPRTVHCDKEKEFNLINVGSMETLYKAQDTLIRAVKDCLDRGFKVRLKLVGDGRCRTHFEKLVVELCLQKHVDFLGMLPGPQAVMEKCDETDIFILPSLVEGIPRALIEAMARGMPCIATNVGGIPELLPQWCLVPPSDYVALADKLIEVITNPSMMNEMSSINITKAREFAAETLNDKRIRFYRFLCNHTTGHDKLL